MFVCRGCESLCFYWLVWDVCFKLNCSLICSVVWQPLLQDLCPYVLCLRGKKKRLQLLPGDRIIVVRSAGIHTTQVYIDFQSVNYSYCVGLIERRMSSSRKHPCFSLRRCTSTKSCEVVSCRLHHLFYCSLCDGTALRSLTSVIPVPVVVFSQTLHVFQSNLPLWVR